jgi:hypothetical protein
MISISSRSSGLRPQVAGRAAPEVLSLEAGHTAEQDQLGPDEPPLPDLDGRHPDRALRVERRHDPVEVAGVVESSSVAE